MSSSDGSVNAVAGSSLGLDAGSQSDASTMSESETRERLAGLGDLVSALEWKSRLSLYLRQGAAGDVDNPEQRAKVAGLRKEPGEYHLLADRLKVLATQEVLSSQLAARLFTTLNKASAHMNHLNLSNVFV